jgi:hypothetical protein
MISTKLSINTDLLGHKLCSHLHWINIPLSLTENLKPFNVSKANLAFDSN